MSYWYQQAIATNSNKVAAEVRNANAAFKQARIDWYKEKVEESDNPKTKRVWQDDVDRINSGKDVYGEFIERKINGVTLFTTETNRLPDEYQDLYHSLAEYSENVVEFCVIGEEGETEYYHGNFNWVGLPAAIPVILIKD